MKKSQWKNGNIKCKEEKKRIEGNIKKEYF